MSRGLNYLLWAGVALFVAAATAIWLSVPVAWSDREIDVLRSLWIGSLTPLPPDPTNRVADDPRAQDFGHQLFFDTRFSGNGAISCATCHQPPLRFTDQLAVSRAIGTSKRNAPSLIGSAYSPWYYWDGRKDSLWSQALAPLEDAAEHGGNRVQFARLVTLDPTYATSYENLFGPLPDMTNSSRFPAGAGPVDNPMWAAAWQTMALADRLAVNRVYTNMGKAIAAYERLLLPGPSRFDTYVQAILADDLDTASATYSDHEVRGLRLFIGEANCTQCHNGPLLTNNAFHNTGLLPRPGTTPDKGRSTGLRQLLADSLNCLGAYSDDASGCLELRFVKTGPELVGAFRTPSLRNLGQTQPYGHAGQHANLAAVLAHYNTAPESLIGHNEAKPINLWPWQLGYLEAFLLTLDAPLVISSQWFEPPTKPTPHTKIEG